MRKAFDGVIRAVYPDYILFSTRYDDAAQHVDEADSVKI
jgi:hypothetical protein